MAATDRLTCASAGAWGSVVAAAFALPGIAAAQATPLPGPQERPGGQEEPGLATAPGAGLIGVRWLSYRDWQPGLERIKVQSQSLVLRLPAGARWVVDAVAGLESVSGASPRYHTAVSGASRMEDRRRSADVRVTHYGNRATWSLATAQSKERDFRSRAFSARLGWATDDNNRSWSVEVGSRSDDIGSSNDPTLIERRRTTETGASITQALSRQDIVHAGLTHAVGHGYYSDPYKLPDARPDSRHQTVIALRWNHHFDQPDVALRTGYRLYRDSFGIRSHTLTVEPVFAVGSRVSIAPSVRLYSQSAASFYYNPRYAYPGVPFPAGEPAPTYISADQRLAAFGAVTLGVRLGIELGDGWHTDLKLERYEQRTAWHLRSEGSRGLAPFSASFVQLGLVRRF